MTRLICHTPSGPIYEYDSSREEFMTALAEKDVRSFKVEIAFNSWRIKGQDEVGTTSSVGTLLQAFTHEITVHAENMLDFIEDYWAYFDGVGQTVPPGLPSFSEEHGTFKKREVRRYEYMTGRVGTLIDQLRSKDYLNRQVNDMFTAH